MLAFKNNLSYWQYCTWVLTLNVDPLNRFQGQSIGAIKNQLISKTNNLGVSKNQLFMNPHGKC